LRCQGDGTDLNDLLELARASPVARHGSCPGRELGIENQDFLHVWAAPNFISEMLRLREAAVTNRAIMTKE
jgi:hypothetical protein